MRQRRPLLAALAALAALLFTQVAIAIAAWDQPASPCHEQAPSANFCYQHCSNNDLTLDTPGIKIPTPPAASLPVALPVPAWHPQHAPLRISILPAGPPPRILYHSFLI